MKIATWNVNSVRTRITHVCDWLQANPEVDVLCLQETKVVDGDFPHSPFTELGYQTYIYGQKSYNGVALISRSPLQDIQTGFAAVLGEISEPSLEDQKRLIAAKYGDVQIVNMYVPNGSEVGSEKYEYKLRWLKLLKEYLQALLNQNDKVLICGDFNVAIADLDIYDPKGRENKVMSTDIEREALDAVLNLGFKDVFRKFESAGGYYSWWDYRSGGFSRNRGWRIDYHFLTEPLYDRATACAIDVEPRKLTQPSDHTPVIVTID
ncbi:exodeoxyribonuclease III [Pseudanabaena sp. UWO310]|uniref:exodeoxyribonuclease III n=1 Tax=Pseudanabaena sp. UWO310 TaxID=2480795 RepID=UPI001157BAE8|nr:exodeoxyribonuclease III [Pseudanabaena sp. UWO310]TYQ31375.1 exodeoxyribonuclease III [Pseudanabaena sp. UWO310]